MNMNYFEADIEIGEEEYEFFNRPFEVDDEEFYEEPDDEHDYNDFNWEFYM